MQHSKYSPSSSERWLSCPGSLDVKADSDDPSEYAREGTAAHRLAHRCWLLGMNPESLRGKEIDGFEVTDDMINAVQMYLDCIQAKLEDLPGESKKAELEVQFTHPIFPDFGGTVDCLITSDVSFAIIDFKYGAGVAVDVEENSQLSCYALLVASSRLARRQKFTEGPELVIVQPRASHTDGPIRSWCCDGEYLRGFNQRVFAVMSGKRKGELSAGDHCRWCPGKVNCSALRQQTLAIARQEFAEEDMTPELAAEVLASRIAIESYLKSVECWAHGQMDKGFSVPGYKLVNTLGNRRYAIDEAEIVRRCRNRRFGKKQIYKTELLSPAQLEKVIGKELLAPMVERPSKGTRVVPESDKRPAVVRQSASEEFAQENAQ